MKSGNMRSARGGGGKGGRRSGGGGGHYVDPHKETSLIYGASWVSRPNFLCVVFVENQPNNRLLPLLIPGSTSNMWIKLIRVLPWDE